MKKNFIQLFILVTFISQALAQDLGKVVIRNSSPDYPKFIVSLNGVRLSNEYNSSVNFDYLDDQNYRVKILQAGSGNFLQFKLNSAPKYISKYMISKDNTGSYSLVLESKALITNEPEQPAQPPATVMPASEPRAIEQPDYEAMVSAIKKESFENTKLDMAKTFFGTQYLSSEQVYGVLKLLSFENNRVNFAKFAYTRTVDKQNYYKVYEALNFSNSKKEVSDHIKKNP